MADKETVEALWWEVILVGLGKEVEISPVEKAYKWAGDKFEIVEEKTRKVVTEQPKGSLKLNFFNTSGPVDLPPEQNIHYGKYSIVDLESKKEIFIDFRDAEYPYQSGVVNMVAKFDDLKDSEIVEIWNWKGNSKEPSQKEFQKIEES